MRHLIFLPIIIFTFIGTNSALAESTLKWVGCGITKKAFMQELALAYEKKTGIKIDLHGGGATRGIRDIVTGTADLGGACRYKLEMNKKEEAANMTPVAWDALAVIVHKSNSVDNVTLANIRDIYLGKIKNWKQLGGKNSSIHLYVREGRLSGVGYTIRKLVFANYDQEFKAAKIFKSSGPLEKAVEEDPDAIGITGISSARKRQVSVLKLEGKEPTYENIREGNYLLYRPLYLVTSPAGEARKEIKDFLRFAHSEEGQEVIRRNGTVPYLDALKLVMKQMEQDARAYSNGL